MGCYPTSGFCEFNPGVTATPACNRKISWSSRFSVPAGEKGNKLKLDLQPLRLTLPN